MVKTTAFPFTMFSFALFPHGALDQSAWDRATVFARGFTPLPGTEWTTFHFPHDPPMPLPPPHVQAAWPWRREIWTVSACLPPIIGASLLPL